MRQANLASAPDVSIVIPVPLPVIGSIPSGTVTTPNILVVGGIATTKGGNVTFPIPLTVGGTAVLVNLAGVGITPGASLMVAPFASYSQVGLNLNNGGTALFEVNNAGDLFVKPFRRSEVISQSTQIVSSAAAVTVLNASGALIFNDITKFFLSVQPLAAGSVPISFTATLSDGTKNYVFDLQADALGTAILISTPAPSLNLDFNPPLQATTAATVWTVTLSVNTVTVNITVLATVQKIS